MISVMPSDFGNAGAVTAVIFRGGVFRPMIRLGIRHGSAQRAATQDRVSSAHLGGRPDGMPVRGGRAGQEREPERRRVAGCSLQASRRGIAGRAARFTTSAVSNRLGGIGGGRNSVLALRTLYLGNGISEDVRDGGNRIIEPMALPSTTHADSRGSGSH